MTVGSVYYAADCDRTLLDRRKISVVGYGSQGRAFCLNLAESGCNVAAVLRESSVSRPAADEDGIAVISPTECRDSDIIILAIPDHEQIGFYREYLQEQGNLKHAIVLLHGLNFHFRNIQFSEAEDVILVAPHGPGADLRRLYREGKGMSCFLAVGQDATGHAHGVGLAIADAVGCSRAGIHETTFEAETIGDLFGEQALLVGGLAGLTNAVVRLMLASGLPEKNVKLETVNQLRLLATMIERYGTAGMLERVSKTAALGSLEAMPRLFDKGFETQLRKLYRRIESGEFNRDLLADAATGFRRFETMLEEFRTGTGTPLVAEPREQNRE